MLVVGGVVVGAGVVVGTGVVVVGIGVVVGTAVVVVGASVVLVQKAHPPVIGRSHTFCPGLNSKPGGHVKEYHSFIKHP